MTYSIDPFSMYSIVCCGFKYNLAVLVVSHIRILDRQSVGLHTPPNVAASTMGSYCVSNILKHFVPLPQRNESCKAMNQLFNVCT